MKRLFVSILLVAALTACNDSADAEKELDTLGQKVEEAWDSTKAEVKEVKDSLESKWERRKDSTDKDSVRSK